jgi:hypothetical protein
MEVEADNVEEAKDIFITGDTSKVIRDYEVDGDKTGIIETEKV